MKTPYYNVPNLQKIADLESEIDQLKIALRDAGEVISYKAQLVLDREVEIETLKAANASFEGGMKWRNGIIKEFLHYAGDGDWNRDLIRRANEVFE